VPSNPATFNQRERKILDLQHGEMMSSERPKNAPAFSAYRPSMDIRSVGTRRRRFLLGEFTNRK
jgi:hypothetical protein